MQFDLGNNMKKVMLFSPTGYIGSYIKDRLIKEKNIQLYEMTRDSDMSQYIGLYDILIYSASVSNADVEKYIQDNVVTAVLMVGFCREHGIKRIIYLSSDSIYGEINIDEVSEKAVMINPDMYGTTKYLAEKIIIASGIPYYILRLPGVVGGIWRKNFISNLMERIRYNEHIYLYNVDREFNNILYIDDLTKFILLLCNYADENQGEIFLLGNTEKIELMQIVAYLKELYNSTSSVSSIDTEQKRYFTLDVTKAVKYGYTAKSIKEILDSLYQIWEEKF